MEKNTIPQSDYMKHEDTLMNVRMTWFLTTQAFLFSCYALLNQKRISAGSFELVRSWQEFIGDITDLKFRFGAVILVLICFFGFFTARRSYISVRAASLAVIALRSKWDAELAQNGFGTLILIACQASPAGATQRPGTRGGLQPHSCREPPW